MAIRPHGGDRALAGWRRSAVRPGDRDLDRPDIRPGDVVELPHAPRRVRPSGRARIRHGRVRCQSPLLLDRTLLAPRWTWSARARIPDRGPRAPVAQRGPGDRRGVD